MVLTQPDDIEKPSTISLLEPAMEKIFLGKHLMMHKRETMDSDNSDKYSNSLTLYT